MLRVTSSKVSWTISDYRSSLLFHTNRSLTLERNLSDVATIHHCYSRTNRCLHDSTNSQFTAHSLYFRANPETNASLTSLSNSQHTKSLTNSLKSLKDKKLYSNSFEENSLSWHWDDLCRTLFSPQNKTYSHPLTFDPWSKSPSRSTVPTLCYPTKNKTVCLQTTSTQSWSTIHSNFPHQNRQSQANRWVKTLLVCVP